MAVLLLNNSTSIEQRIFAHCNRLKKMIVPSSIQSIQKEAFFLCISLSQVEFESPCSLETIEKSAFESTGIKQLNIENMPLNSIESKAFYNCKKLNEVQIVSTPLKKLGDFSFRFCSLLSKVNLPPSLTEIGKGSFGECVNLNEINLPSSLLKIEDYLFMNCKSLKKIEIPGKVDSIGFSSFAGCSSLSEVIFECDSLLKNIGECAFRNCVALKEINIPSSSDVAQNAFKGCTLLIKK